MVRSTPAAEAPDLLFAGHLWPEPLTAVSRRGYKPLQPSDLLTAEED